MDFATLNRPSVTRPLLFCSVAFALLVVLARKLGALIVPHAIITKDVSVYIYWMRRFQDPELFQNDLLTEFASAPFFAKKGLTALYYLASFLIDPVTFCAVLPLILVPITAYYLFQLGRLIKDNVTATTLVLLYLPMIWGRDPSGLQREFALPLLVPFLYYLMRQRYAVVLLLLTLQGLFYPPILLVSLGVFAFSAVALEGRRLRLDRRKAGYLALSLLLAVAVLAPDYIFYKNARLGPLVTRAQTWQMPEVHAEGRDAYFRTSVLDYVTWGFLPEQKFLPRYARFQWLLYLAALAVAVTLWKGKRWHLPREIVALPLSAVAMFVAAHIFWPRLYFPSRFPELAVPLFAMIVIAADLLTVVPLWAEFGLRKDLIRPSSRVPALFLLAFILCSYFIVWKKPIIFRCPFPALLGYVETLPKDVLIAGHPVDMDWVPTCARRKVLVNERLSEPWYLNYYREVKQRKLDFFNAYYANSPETIRRFAEKYGIDYLVVDDTDFPREGKVAVKPLFEPFRGYVRALIARNAPGGFAILDYPYGQVVWREKTRFVIRVHRGVSGGARSTSEDQILANGDPPLERVLAVSRFPGLLQENTSWTSQPPELVQGRDAS